MPLIDRYGRLHTYLRVSVTDRCNLRCSYCMPADGMSWTPREDILTFEEIYRICRIAVAEGVNKIRLTGGEPTVRQDIEVLVEMLASLPGLKTLTMTTNGVLLHHKAAALKRAGMISVNISLDTLRKLRFAGITARDRLDDVLRGIDAAFNVEFDPIKLNIVVMAGINNDEIFDFVELGRARPLNVRFVEFMPFPGNPWRSHQLISSLAVRNRIESRYDLIPIVADTHAAAARSYRIRDFAGSISFISPMSEDFCGACNRLRLAADGAIKSCLLRPAETSLRDALRNGACDSDILTLIRTALGQKQLSHPSANFLPNMLNRRMMSIGG